MITPRHTPRLTYEECVERYPLLIRALQWVIIGTQSEAGCIIRDYRDGFDFSCEACSHSGLTPLDRIRRAWELRGEVRRIHAFRAKRTTEAIPEYAEDRFGY